MEKLKNMLSSDKNEQDESEEYAKKLRELLIHDCNRGKKEGCHELGEFFQVVERDKAEAAKCYKTNCDERNYMPSCFSLGYLYFKSKEKDYQNALKYFEKGCGNSSPGACNNAALIYLNGHEKSQIEKDIDKAIKYFEMGCDFGHRGSCFNLSSIYLTGKEGIAKNMEKALDLSIKSCDLGHPWACANLSRIYKIGDGVEKDGKKAMEYRKLAEELHKTS